MDFKLIKPLKYNQKLLVYAACLILFSLALHTLSVNHRHPAFLGEGMQAVAHGEDKKFFAILAMIFVLSLAESFIKISLSYVFKFKKYPSGQFYLKFKQLKIYNYLFQFLRKGLLEPRPI